MCAAIAPAQATQATIDSITVKWRDAIPPETTLPESARAALSAALRMPFLDVGRARDGAFHLELPESLLVDEARAAVNRVRMLAQVLYADINEPKSQAGEEPSLLKASPRGPPIRRMIVKYRDAEISDAARRNTPLPEFLLQRLSVIAGQPIAHQRAMSGGAFVVSLFELLPLAQARSLARYLETDPAIEYAEPDLLKHPSVVPNDASFASQWHYFSPATEPGGINLPSAWDITTGATGIVTAVLDTGHLPAHPDLAGRFVGGYDFIGDALVGNDGGGRDADPTDSGDWVTGTESAAGHFEGCFPRNSTFHGSHVAGTIGAASNNGGGVTGVNWVSKILPLRVLGKCGGYTSDIADAIRWSVGIAVPGIPANLNPARVLNLSFGGYACDSNGQNCACENTSQNAINAAISTGAAVVVAAGNGNASAVEGSPANCNGVITVAATGRSGQRASYSNYGALVEIAAPGGSDGNGVLSTINAGATSPDPAGYSYAWYQGTSMATPHVAGVASLMLSINPSLTPAQVLAIIQTTARAFPVGTGRDCTTALCGAGIIDAAAAVRAASNGAAAAATTTTLTSSANPASSGASVVFTATVSGSAPSGSVNFVDGGASITGCSAVKLAGAGNSRTATCSTNSLPAGTRSIVANYAGDATNAASASSAIAQVINAGLVEGYHDIADCRRIAGWAWDSNLPNTAISVDIYSGDTRILTALADVLRPDVRDAGKGDGVHGFDVVTPASLKDGQPHSITVKFAGTATNLFSTPKTITCAGSVVPPSFEGYHDVASCSQISGWGWDSSRPNTPISVDIYSNNTRLLTALAGVLRPDLRAAGKGDGVHGFDVVTPASLKDGQPHSITIKFAGTSTNLFSTPKTITCGGNVAPPSFEGYHDAASCGQITGWAWDSSRPNTPISVDIYGDGTLVATLFADVLRPDVRDAGKGDGVHGFALTTPASLKDGQPHNIAVKFGQTQTDLFRTPKTLSCAP